MKKSILAFAVVSAFAGTASAQSNVSVYGVVDLGLTYSRSDVAASTVGMTSGNWYGSRLGFRGTEDLGGGLSVGFQYESGINATNGQVLQGGRMFGRHSWLSVQGGFGKVTLGRQWMPAYTLIFNVIDPFEDGLAGASSAVFGRNVFNDVDVRMDSAVTYSFAAGDFKADLAYAFGGVAGNSAANRQLGAAFTYGAGPLKAVVGYHNVNDATATGSAKLAFVGGNYDFGAVKLHLGLDSQKTDAAGVTTVDANAALVGVTVPLGGGRILASYNRRNDNTAANVDISRYGIAYAYDLSKRTTLYTSYGHTSLNNLNRFNAGIRHKF